jgi:hypothetical protein
LLLPDAPRRQFEFPLALLVCQCHGRAFPHTLPSAARLNFRPLAGRKASRHTALMKGFVGLLVALLTAGGIYFFYMKRMPSADVGTAPTQAISLTGVRMDLMQIAQAERAYLASNGRCGSLGDLTSSGTQNLARTERDGYSYEVKCGDGSDFAVIAHHAPAPPDSPIRYPILAIDQNLQVGEAH